MSIGRHKFSDFSRTMILNQCPVTGSHPTHHGAKVHVASLCASWPVPHGWKKLHQLVQSPETPGLKPDWRWNLGESMLKYQKWSQTLSPWLDETRLLLPGLGSWEGQQIHIPLPNHPRGSQRLPLWLVGSWLLSLGWVPQANPGSLSHRWGTRDPPKCQENQRSRWAAQPRLNTAIQHPWQPIQEYPDQVGLGEGGPLGTAGTDWRENLHRTPW